MTKPKTSNPQPLMLRCAMTFEPVEAMGEGKPALPRFNMVAYTGGPMRIAGWRFPVVVDLAGLAIPSQQRPIRLGHDASLGVGHTESIRIENGHLLASGSVSRDTSSAREVVTSSRNGFPWQASIGASVEESEFVRESQSVIVNGKEFSGPVNVVRKATLGEISFVDMGADGQTSANVAASANEENNTVDKENTTENITTETQVAAAAPATQETPVPPPSESVRQQPSAAAAMRVEAASESERIAAIRKLCGTKYPQIEAQAIREGWDATRCELQIMRESRPNVAAVIVTEPPPSNNLLEAACALTSKLQSPEKFYDSNTLEAAHKRFRGGIGLQELLLEAAYANGYTGRNFRDSRAILRAAFGQSIQAGLSSVDIGGILSNIANKFLLEGFFSVERAWRNICAVRNVTDFKTITSYRLIGKDQYELVAPGGQLKSGTLGNETYTNKADTYGLTLSIDRRDIINDDLGAITLVPRKLGRGSGLKINDVFWAIFLNNSTFFTAGNKNFLSGTDTVLSVDGMSKAEVAFMDQVDSDGKPIGVMPTVILVPTALSAVGTQLYKSMEIRDTNTANKYPVANPHQGKFRVEVSRYLGNARYTGNSTKAWYLLAEPTDLPVIEVAFLNGQESPIIETAEADFSVLGIQMRGYHDFGVALQDPRGAIKAKGEA